MMMMMMHRWSRSKIWHGESRRYERSTYTVMHEIMEIWKLDLGTDSECE